MYLQKVSQKYISMLEGKGFKAIQNFDGGFEYPHLLWMLYQIRDNEFLSETKKNRWLGFIQGCFAKDGVLDIKTERDKTRDIFKGK